MGSCRSESETSDDASVSVCHYVSAWPPGHDRHSPRVNDEETRTRSVPIVARSVYRDLVAQGFDDNEILAIAIELIGKITEKHTAAPRPRA